MSTPTQGAKVPRRSGLVLTTLILSALVCNINLSVANIALPEIGRAFDTGQTQVNLVALGCSLGLAMSVLYFGAIGDRYGRKLMLVIGLGATVPASFLSAWAPNVELLIAGRILTGVAAGMAYPTTLALITALWGPGPKRVKAIALWSGVSGGAAVTGAVFAGAMLEFFWWGSVFLIVVPPAIVAFFLVIRAVPAHVNESKDPVDNLGGVLSWFMIGFFVLGISMISAPGMLALSLALLAGSVVATIAFLIRQRKASNPLYDLRYAKRRLFWVPAIAGMIVFGALMGAMFVGQQFLQNVLGYSTLEAGAGILPSAFAMILVAPTSAKLVEKLGSRLTLLIGFAFLFPAFLVMLLTWKVETSYFWVALAYALIGIGAGIALTPASRSLTSSVPVARVGMASGTTDLQRDLGGSTMQALLGSLLTAGYAYAFSKQLAVSDQATQVSQATQTALLQSFSSAQNLAAQYPQYAAQITTAARESFLAGANLAYAAAALAVLLGGLLVLLRFPKRNGELTLEAEYEQQDATSG